jgi:hypothetical protein
VPNHFSRDRASPAEAAAAIVFVGKVGTVLASA